MVRRLALVAVAAATVGCTVGEEGLVGLWAHDWPQFGRSPAFLSYNDDSSAPKHKEWTWKNDNKLVASPAVAAGRVWLGSDDGNVYCLNQTTGLELWHFVTGKGELGVRSSPAVHADLSVSFGSYDGFVYHVDVNGNLIWKYDTGSKIYCPATVDSAGIIYIGNYDNCIYALHSEKKVVGQLKWKTCAKGWGAINSGPAFSPNSSTLVINDFDGHIRGLDMESGNIKWTYETGSASGSSATIVGDTAFIGSWSKFVYALSVSTGELKWKFDTGGEVESHPAYHDGVIFVTAEESCAIFALNASTGDVIWKRVNIASQEINGSPSVTAEAVYFGANDGNLYALDRVTGATKFTFHACSQHIFSSAAIGDNGMLYFTCGDDAEDPSPAPNAAFALDPAQH